MAIIYSYPRIGALEGQDLMIISDIQAEGNPTKSVTLSQLTAFIKGTPSGGLGTTNYIPKWVDGPNSILGDSPIFTFDGGAGLKQAILTDGYRFVVDRDAATTVGDPEYAITQNGVNKTSFGWDDDGGGFGFIYNWAGKGFKLGGATLYPQFEVLTDPDIKNITFADFEFEADIIDITGSVGTAGQVLSSLGTGNGVQWITTGVAGVSDITTATGVSTGDPITPLAAATGSVTITSNAYAGTTNVGYVPSGGSNTTFLRGDGTWVTPAGGGTIKGAGTINTLPVFTAADTIGDSICVQDAGATIATINGERLVLGDGSLNRVDIKLDTTAAAGDETEIQSQGSQFMLHELGSNFIIGPNDDIQIDDSGAAGVTMLSPTTFVSDILDIGGTAGSSGQILASNGGGSAGVSWESPQNLIGYRSVQVFQWPNGTPVAYTNWTNGVASNIPFNTTPLVETGNYAGTAANFAWTCINNAGGTATQEAQFTLGTNGAGTWQIETCQHWFDQTNQVEIRVSFQATSGAVTTQIDVIDEKSTELSGDKIFYGTLVREFAAGDKLEVDVEFVSGGVNPFPSDAGNRPIEITFTKLV